MFGKGPLWKNIGKEGTQKSPQSSLSSCGRPVKAFHIMFEDDGGGRSDHEQQARRNQHSPQNLKHSSSINNQLQCSPMIITDDYVERSPHNEEVLEVISFDSHENERVVNMDHVLKSMTQISQKARQGQESLQSRSIERLSFMHKIQAIEKMRVIKSDAHRLRQELDSYKFYLLTVLSQWEVEAINNFKAMKDRIDSCLTASTEKPKEDPNKYLALQQEVTMLGRSLALQREAREIQRRENQDLEDKLKRLERGQNEQRHRLSSDQTLLDELKNKNKKIEAELSEVRLEAQSQTAKVGKLKQVVREREVYVASQHQQSLQLQKKIKQLKLILQQGENRERKLGIEIKSLKQRMEKQKQVWDKETSRNKLQLSKLKNLLKVSEEQLSQCEEYISKLNTQIKELHAQGIKSQEKLRTNQAQYIKKLQECDQYLIQLENNVKNIMAEQSNREQQYDLKESELSRMREECQNKIIEIRSKEAQIDQIKKQYEHKIMNLSRREDGMKAQYRMAIDVQNAVKDKWYHRYNTMFSPQRLRSEQVISPPHRDINPLSGRSSFARKEVAEAREAREARSPLRDRLYKAKSQRNFNLIRNQSGLLNSARNELDRCQSQRDLVSLGSRINTLRRELTRQLGQMGLKS